MQQRNISIQKAQQRLKNTPLRKSTCQFGKMDQVSTQSQTNNSQHANKTAVHQNLNNQYNQSDKDKVSIGKEICTSMLTNGNATSWYTDRSKTLFKQLTMFLLASIGTRSQVFNSGGKIHMFNSDDKYKSLPEFKIELRERELQSINHERKELELQDIIDDENDKDWSFVSKAILDHHKRTIPRYMEIRTDEEGKHILLVKRNAHLRVKILWKNGLVSWAAGDAVRL